MARILTFVRFSTKPAKWGAEQIAIAKDSKGKEYEIPTSELPFNVKPGDRI